MYETSDYRNKGDKIIRKFTKLMKLSGIGIDDNDITLYPRYSIEKTEKRVLDSLEKLGWSDYKQSVGMKILRTYNILKSYDKVSEELKLSEETISSYIIEMEKSSNSEIIIRKGKVPYDTKNRNRERVSSSDKRNKRASKLSIHSLRGTFISRAANLGYSLAEIQHFLGSVSRDVILKHYYHNIVPSESANQKISRVLDFLKSQKKTKLGDTVIKMLE